jgi:hypothetical protein
MRIKEEKKMNRKQLLMMSATITMLTTLIVPMFLMQVTLATDPSDWYMTVNGVLDTDYYTLYPYETDESLKIGFSKFGELINSEDNVGLEYGTVDPFAPAAGSTPTTQVPKHVWVQGWLVNITYNHRTKGTRNVWATAMHSDSVEYGKDWIRVDFNNDYSTTYGDEDPRDPGYMIYDSGTYGTTLEYGGRKTNGTAVTEDIEVLYDGPRKFVAICRTRIYDHPTYCSNSTAGDVALVEIAITIEFNKVKKEVNLLKDVKSLLAWKEGEKMKIELSNRGEVDLGTDTTGYGSYAHFWTEGTSTSSPPDSLVEGQSTVYDSSWTLVKSEDPDNTDYEGFSAAGPYPQDMDATYDVAQAINPDAGYVWLAGFWPSLNDWSIDGWDQWWHSLKASDPHYIDYRTPTEEPFIPFYIGEWDFMLWHSADSEMRTQFRGVTTYGLTDYHDAGDINMGSNENRLDREVQYQLDEKYKPFDLNDAVHKATKRWVEWKPNGPTSYTLTRATPVVVVPDEEWDQYCEFSERVIRLDTGELLHRRSNDPAAGGTKDYNIILNPDGTATLTGLPPAKCKILYSTKEMKGVTNGLIQLGLCLDGSGSITAVNWTIIKNGVADAIINSLPHDSSVELTVVQFGFDDPLHSQIEIAPTIVDSDATANAIAAAILAMAQGNDNTPMAHGLNLTWTAMKNSPRFVSSEAQIINLATDGKPNVQLPEGSTGDAADDVTLVRDMAYLEGLDEIDSEAIGADPVLTWMRDGLVLPQPGTIAPPYEPGWVEAVPDAAAFAAAMATKFEVIIPWRGRYEWVIVGRDAYTVDSAGAVLVAAAVKQKNIEIGLAGADMWDTLTAAQMPYTLSKFGTGNTMNDYKDEIGRAALKDDWCTYWPVASSNIIGVGGPIANMLAYYANDFTDAIYGLPVYAGLTYYGKVTGVPCWNRGWNGTWNAYSSFDSPTLGYAVISTYKDINGTVIFDVWGHWGRDTYYATQWLHGDEARCINPGIHQLQVSPDGLTSIILQINYTDPEHPTFSIPELLGTISETEWEHTYTNIYTGLEETETKGGIHDP